MRPRAGIVRWRTRLPSRTLFSPVAKPQSRYCAISTTWTIRPPANRRVTVQVGSKRPRFSSKPGGATTMPYAHMAAWDTGRRHRKRSSGQAGRPAPLRSAGHPARRRNRRCTNIQTGPVSGGRSATTPKRRRPKSSTEGGTPRAAASKDSACPYSSPPLTRPARNSAKGTMFWPTLAVSSAAM